MGFGAVDRGRHIALAALLLPAAVPRPATFSHDGGREGHRHLALGGERDLILILYRCHYR